MDTENAILIDKDGKETQDPLSDLEDGAEYPEVLIKLRVRSNTPSRVFVIDNGEAAKRNWIQMVYREVDALFI